VIGALNTTYARTVRWYGARRGRWRTVIIREQWSRPNECYRTYAFPARRVPSLNSSHLSRALQASNCLISDRVDDYEER